MKKSEKTKKFTEHRIIIFRCNFEIYIVET